MRKHACARAQAPKIEPVRLLPALMRYESSQQSEAATAGRLAARDAH
jgi:hypothetical protein